MVETITWKTKGKAKERPKDALAKRCTAPKMHCPQEPKKRLTYVPI
jgi:hypothetical protein